MILPHPIKVQLLTAEFITQDFLDCFIPLRPSTLTVEEAKKIWWEDMTNLGRIPTNVFIAIELEKVVGTATLLLDRKFLGHGKIAGHVEDVSVHKDHQDKGIGTLLIEKLIRVAKNQGCYKVILDCKPSLTSFYGKFGFKESDYHMRLDLT